MEGEEHTYDYLFKNLQRGIEIEARLGIFKQKRGTIFVPGVDIQSFFRLINFFKSYPEGKVFYEESTVKIFQVDNINYLVTTKDNRTYYDKKETMVKKNVVKYGFRLAKSEESYLEPNEAKELLKNIKTDGIVRHKKRYTYETSQGGEDSIFNGVKIDMTIVNQDGTVNYEVEVEIVGYESKYSKMLNTVKILNGIIQLVNLESMNVRSLLEYKNIEELLRFTLSYQEKNIIADKFNKLLKLRPKENKPLIKYRNEVTSNLDISFFLEDHRYAISSKVDGIRKQLFIDADGKCYLINPFYDLSYIGTIKNKDIFGSIFDGELYGNTFYCFDVLVIKYTLLTDKLFEDRYDNIVEFTIDDSYIKVVRKQFFIDDNVYDSINKATQNNILLENNKIKTDGIILQPMDEKYLNTKTYKWKPAQYLTIDFFMHKIDTAPLENEFNICVFNESSTYEAFRGSVDFPYQKTMTFKDNKFQEQFVDKRIIECEWDYSTNNFKPLKFRDDKPFANKLNVAINIWNDIQNPLLEKTIRGRDLVVMKKVHENIKTYLIEKFSNIGNTILNISNFDKQSMRIFNKNRLNVVLIDKDKRKISEQLKDIGGSFRIFSSLKKVSIKDIDVVFSFSSLTNIAKTKELFEMFIEQLNDVLSENSFFVGIVLDGTRVHEFLKRKEKGIELFKIKLEKSEKSLYGKLLNITMGEEQKQEYLFNFKNFASTLQKYNIEIFQPEDDPTRYEQLFIDHSEEYDILPNDAKKLSRLYRVFVFRKTTKKTDVKTVVVPTTTLLKSIDESPNFPMVLVKNLKIDEIKELANGFLYNTLVERYKVVEGYKSVERYKFPEKYTLAERFQGKYPKDYSISDIDNKILETFKNLILKDVLYDNLEMIQFISKRINKNIYLMNENNIFYIPKASSEDFSEEESIKLLYRYKESIVIKTNQGEKYEEMSFNKVDGGVVPKNPFGNDFHFKDTFSKWKIFKYEDKIGYCLERHKNMFSILIKNCDLPPQIINVPFDKVIMI